MPTITKAVSALGPPPHPAATSVSMSSAAGARARMRGAGRRYFGTSREDPTGRSALNGGQRQ